MSVPLIEDRGDNWESDGQIFPKTALNTCSECGHFRHFLLCDKSLETKQRGKTDLTFVCGCKGDPRDDEWRQANGIKPENLVP